MLSIWTRLKFCRLVKVQDKNHPVCLDGLHLQPSKAVLLHGFGAQSGRNVRLCCTNIKVCFFTKKYSCRANCFLSLQYEKRFEDLPLVEIIFGFLKTCYLPPYRIAPASFKYKI